MDVYGRRLCAEKPQPISRPNPRALTPRHSSCECGFHGLPLSYHRLPTVR